MPEPERISMAFEHVSATVGTEDVVLEAEVSVDGTLVAECGFLYGDSEDNMVEVSAQMADGRFSKSVGDLNYQQEYVYMAYVGNGKNRLHSDKHTFIAPSRPDMYLSVNELNVGPSGGTYEVTVRHGDRYDVIVPETVDWIGCSVEGPLCVLNISESDSADSRECDIRFVRSDDGCECTLHVFQEAITDDDSQEEPGGMEIQQVIDVEISHLWQTFSVFLSSDWDVNAYAHEDDEYIFYGDAGYLLVEVSENKSMSPRTICIQISSGVNEYVINIVQHAYLENVDFEDPEAKKACVSRWDRNGDGELSFEEVVGVTDMDKECFAGYDITSFDELKYFGSSFNVYNMPDYLFEGSSIESVTLPSGLYDGTGCGIFKDCRNLSKVDLGNRRVDAEAFMNCTAIKEIDALIEGERAFMGCTALETVVQKCNCVPEMAFKDCSSLRTFTFEKVFWASSVTIGKEAFYGCSSLSEINGIPIDIEEIRESAFSGCTSLEEIRLQYKLKTIGPRAFYGCSNLKAVYLTSGVPPTIGSEAFQGTSEDLKFYVPETLVNVYKSNWPDLADRIEGI